MDMQKPKVSVLMSVYNGEPYLQEAIDSILSQTFSDFEFIIVDDCSTDNSGEILSRYAKQDQRIVLVKNRENLGLTKSLNKGLNLAKGDYIARQDADDISLPQRLEDEVAVLDFQMSCTLVSCDIQIIGSNSKSSNGVMKRACSSELVTWRLLFYNHIAGHSQVMYRKEDVLSLGGYSESLRYTQDYELWCRLAASKQKFIILPKILLSYRIHPQSVSQKKAKTQESSSIKQIQLNIKNLINQSITEEEAKILTGFWKATLNSRGAYHQFPSANQAGFVYNLLNEIKEQFIQKYEPVFGSNLSSQIDAVIRQQFLFWLTSPLTSNHSVWSKVLISRYALLMSPLGVLKAWLVWFFRFPIDTFHSICNKAKGQFNFRMTTSGS